MTEIHVKRCAKCKATKHLEEFPSSNQQRDGLFPYCWGCKRAADRAYQARHKEEISVKNAARYAANPEPYIARAKKRYEAKTEEINAYTRAWQLANPEKRKAASAGWMKRNPEAVRENTRRRYARRKGAVAIKFSAHQLAQRMAYWGDRCWVCGDLKAAVDHVKPLSKGGAHMLCNLRPICWSCNSSKSAAWPINTRSRHGSKV